MPRDTWRSLDPVHIISTAARLERRIRERFPDASLARLAAELHEVAREAAERTTAMRRPNWWLRMGVGIMAGALLILVAAAAAGLQGGPAVREWGPLVQTVESTINDLVFIGIAVVFLLSLERRLQRRRELRAIHELRSIAHIVDLHQLTKDPDRLRHDLPDTASSPDRPLGPVALARYLDYCSELLSLTGKIAAIYGEGIDDPVVLGAVQQVEALATGLSHKIWQKIMILDAATAPGA